MLQVHGIKAINMEGGIIQWADLTSREAENERKDQIEEKSSKSWCTMI
jgi:hypothetical protein